MARSFVALFLLPESEVAMTTVISSHVKDKNCIFTGYESCVTGKIIGVHIIKKNNNQQIDQAINSPTCINIHRF